MSDKNRRIKADIFASGFHDLKVFDSDEPLPTGSIFKIRRNGPSFNLPNDIIYNPSMVKLYETPNLLENTGGSSPQIKITPDTSVSVIGFEAKNLIKNLSARSCTPGSRACISSLPSYSDYESCFKTTE